MNKQDLIKKLPIIIGLLAFVGVIFLAGYVKSLLEKAPEPKKIVQQVTLIAPPPPPPPPPPEEEPEVEEEVEEEVVEDEPEPTPDEPSEEVASEDLGVDADATAGGDAYGLVAKKGGRGFLGGGYAGYVNQEIEALLREDEILKYLDYRAEIKFLIAESGEFKFKVVMKEGSEKTLERIRQILRKKRQLSRKRPVEAQKIVMLEVNSSLL